MKKKWNEKTKKTAVIAALAVVGILAVAGISFCIYKDTPQKVELVEAQEPEDHVEIPDGEQAAQAGGETGMEKEEDVVVSTEVSKETGTEDTYVQSIQPTPVRTEDQKPAEASDEETKSSEGTQKGGTEATAKPEAQPAQSQPASENADTPKHGDIRGDKIYLDGFGWIDYNGGETVVIQADDIYENGNKIGIMD